MAELKGKKIKLSCTLNDRKGALIAGEGAVLTIGDDVEEAVAKQLLAGGSAALVSARPHTEKEG